jgi:hypothetical protein
MKIYSKPKTGPQALAALLLMLLLVQTASAIQLTNEFWISTNTPTANLGTLADPFDGSTATTFDLAMSNMPPNSVMHILAGTYQTKGWNPCLPWGWRLKTGQKILGSGIDVTIIQEVANVGCCAHVMSTSNTCSGVGFSCSNIEISDLTVDCNFNTNSHGILLHGTTHAIRRVKLINAASVGSTNEVFLLQIDGAGPSSEGNVVEECEVSNFIAIAGGACTAIVLGNSTGFISGVIKNNRVFLAPAYGQLAIDGWGLNNLLVEGNYVNGAATGLYTRYGATNLIASHNIFKNCLYGFSMDNVPRRNLAFTYNNIQLSYSTTISRAGFYFGSSGSYTNVSLIGNTVQFDTQAGALSYGIAATNIVGGTISLNTIDARMSNGFQNCTNLNVFDNIGLDGLMIVNMAQNELPNGIKRTTVTGNYTATYADRYIGVRPTAVCTITLPSAVGYSGKDFTIANEGGTTFTITISPVGSEKINGAASATITTSYSSKKFNSDGANWFTR